jgi:hypothetical protein
MKAAGCHQCKARRFSSAHHVAQLCLLLDAEDESYGEVQRPSLRLIALPSRIVRVAPAVSVGRGFSTATSGWIRSSELPEHFLRKSCPSTIQALSGSTASLSAAFIAAGQPEGRPHCFRIAKDRD